MKFTRHESRIWTAITHVASIHGGKTPVAVRIAPEHMGDSTGDYRVDCKSMSFMPWEAVDAGKRFRTKRDAERFLREWLKAANEQKTLSPRIAA